METNSPPPEAASAAAAWAAFAGVQNVTPNTASSGTATPSPTIATPSPPSSGAAFVQKSAGAPHFCVVSPSDDEDDIGIRAGFDSALVSAATHAPVHPLAPLHLPSYQHPALHAEEKTTGTFTVDDSALGFGFDAVAGLDLSAANAFAGNQFYTDVDFTGADDLPPPPQPALASELLSPPLAPDIAQGPFSNSISAPMLERSAIIASRTNPALALPPSLPGIPSQHQSWHLQQQQQQYVQHQNAQEQQGSQHQQQPPATGPVQSLAPVQTPVPRIETPAECYDLDDPATENAFAVRKRELEIYRTQQRLFEHPQKSFYQQQANASSVKAHALMSRSDDVVVVIDSDGDDDGMAGYMAFSGNENYAPIARQVYSTGGTGKPDEDYDQSAIRKLVEINNNTADATEEVENPPELSVELLRHQKRAVAWMVKRETLGTEAVIQRSPAGFSLLNAHNDSVSIAKDEDDEDDDGDTGTGLEGFAPCRGGILADEQGLGKTLSVIGLMLLNPPAPTTDGKPSKWRTLLVCPLSLADQWKLEIESRTRDNCTPKVYVYHGSSRCRDPAELVKFDVVITTYHIISKEYPKVLRDDPSYAALRKARQPLPRRASGPLYKCQWHRAVLDEAHSIKNRRTESWAAACQLPAERRWALTGTPIQVG
jgi:SNF2-related domain